MYDLNKSISKAKEVLNCSKYTIAFTGAGISVESGIPPFRGEDGIWSKYDPKLLDLDYFYNNPEISWRAIKEIFYDFFGEASPNAAHVILADMENNSVLKSVITQNIDNLHQKAGTKNIVEFHGTCGRLLCTKCHKIYPVVNSKISEVPPTCKECGAMLKPDFIFFGEGIGEESFDKAIEEVSRCEVMIIIGTTGEVAPANQLPSLAKRNGAIIIEVNPSESYYTNSITDILLKGKAGEIMPMLIEKG